MKSKAEKNSAERANTGFCNMSDAKPAVSEEEIVNIFSTGEKVERTPRGAKPPPTSSNKKKKGKK